MRIECQPGESPEGGTKSRSSPRRKDHRAAGEAGREERAVHRNDPSIPTPEGHLYPSAKTNPREDAVEGGASRRPKYLYPGGAPDKQPSATAANDGYSLYLEEVAGKVRVRNRMG